MPLPAPHSGQTQEEWMHTCMGSDAIKEFKTQEQRVAVCLSIYRKHHKKGSAKLGAPPDMNEMIAEIGKAGTIREGDKVRITKLPTMEAQAAFSHRVDTVDPIPLPDGEYRSIRYGYMLEIDGVGYATVSGVRNTKTGARPPQLTLVRGGVAEIHHPSISELGGGTHKWWPDNDPMGSGGARKVAKT